VPVEKDFGSEKLKYLPVEPYFTVGPDAKLGEVIALMKMMRTGSILVIDDNEPVGVFTERDVVIKIINAEVDYFAPIFDFMTPDPDTLNIENTLRDAVDLMIEADIRHLPLVDEKGKRAGLVTMAGIASHIAEHFPDEVFNLPPRLHQNISRPEGG